MEKGKKRDFSKSKYPKERAKITHRPGSYLKTIEEFDKKHGPGAHRVETIGNRVQLIRMLFDMTQKRFAEELGTSQGYLSEIEKAKKFPSISFLNTLGGKFGANTNWVLRGDLPMLVFGIQWFNLDIDRVKKIVEKTGPFIKEFGAEFIAKKKSQIEDPDGLLTALSQSADEYTDAISDLYYRMVSAKMFETENRIKMFRERFGNRTQKEFAESIGIAPLSFEHYEKHPWDAPLYFYSKLAEYGVNINWLFTGVGFDDRSAEWIGEKKRFGSSIEFKYPGPVYTWENDCGIVNPKLVYYVVEILENHIGGKKISPAKRAKITSMLVENLASILSRGTVSEMDALFDVEKMAEDYVSLLEDTINKNTE